MLDRERVARELYDLDEDPLEFFNLIQAHADVAARLSSEAQDAIDGIYNDPLRPVQ